MDSREPQQPGNDYASRSLGLDSFDVVYYPQPVPSSLGTLTILAIIFDKVLFPGVYIPKGGLDEAATVKEIERLKSLGERDIDLVQLINCMIFALHYKYLQDFCTFTGEFGYLGILEDGAKEMTMALEEMVFGPPPPNFTPTPSMGFAKGLPGEREASVNGPSWISYPANALIYSTKHGIPLVNDDPSLPVPGLGGAGAKDNAKILSAILAIESVKLLLPNLRPLVPKEIQEFRQETRELVKPFRLGMLRLSRELNAAIASDMSLDEVQKAARFLAETTVYPEVEELRRVIQDPARPWYRRVIDLAKSAPELASNFVTMPKHLAIAKVLSTLASTLVDEADARREKERQTTRGGLYYLLKIEEKAKLPLR